MDRFILDKNGNCVVEYTYDAWGKLLSTTGSLATTLAGNFIGAKYIFINGKWIQPKYIRSFLVKSYVRKLLAQTGIGSIAATIIDIVKGKLVR